MRKSSLRNRCVIGLTPFHVHSGDGTTASPRSGSVRRVVLGQIEEEVFEGVPGGGDAAGVDSLIDERTVDRRAGVRRGDDAQRAALGIDPLDERKLTERAHRAGGLWF